LNTALILTDDELHKLIALQGNNISAYTKQLVNDMHYKDSDTVDIASSLQEKRLALWDGETIALEPLLKLIIDEACKAVSLYHPTQDSYALECPNMHLLFTRYAWIKDTWRIAPYKDAAALFSSME